AAVGVQRDDDALPVIARKRMLRHGADDVSVDIARQTHLERDLACDNLLEEGGILREPRPVADALRAELVDRLIDGLRPIPFACVTGARHPVSSRVLEG